MILFFLNNENNGSKRLYDKFKLESNIPASLVYQEYLVKNSGFSFEFDGNRFNTYIKSAEGNEVIDCSKVKICYLPIQPYIIDEWLPYESELDKYYSKQEWWASLSSFFSSQKHIKFVNPFYAKWDLYSEFEHLMLFQKFDINTLEMIITNNSKEALNIYNLWDKNVLFKTIRCGYDTSAKMEIPDLARLDKLKLSPVIFQKLITGTEVKICLVGDTHQTVKINFDNNQETYSFIEVPEILINKLKKVNEFLNIPVSVFHLIFSEEDDEYYAFSINIYPDFESMFFMLGETFENNLYNYLTMEYNK